LTHTEEYAKHGKTYTKTVKSSVASVMA